MLGVSVSPLPSLHLSNNKGKVSSPLTPGLDTVLVCGPDSGERWTVEVQDSVPKKVRLIVSWQPSLTGFGRVTGTDWCKDKEWVQVDPCLPHGVSDKVTPVSDGR